MLAEGAFDPATDVHITSAEADGPSSPKRQRRIQSIDVGMRVLKALTEQRRPLPLKALAQLAGMPPGKARREVTDEVMDAIAALSGWEQQGLLVHRETVYDGLESSIDALNGLFTGANIGKMLVKVSDPGIGIGGQERSDPGIGFRGDRPGNGQRGPAAPGAAGQRLRGHRCPAAADHPARGAGPGGLPAPRT